MQTETETSGRGPIMQHEAFNMPWEGLLAWLVLILDYLQYGLSIER